MSARLILHALDPDYVPSTVAQMEQVLLQVGLIGKPWASTRIAVYITIDG